jgi:hypothetical protein
VITLAAPRFASAIRNDSLRFNVEASASDGNGAPLAEEVDALSERSRIILSLCSGRPVAARRRTAPTVPSDAGGERNLSDIVRLTAGHVRMGHAKMGHG